MIRNVLLFFLIFIISSCTSNKNIIYLKDIEHFSSYKIDKNLIKRCIEPNDILNIDVQSIVPEAAMPYNKIMSSGNFNQTMEMIQLEGYLVDYENSINFPVLGKIKTMGLTLHELENNITNLLLEGNHLINPTVKVRRVNSKFTVLGEVRNPGTFTYYDENLNIFQALGFAGDLTIDAKRNRIALLREENGLRKTYNIQLTKLNIINQPYYQIKNNDVIIVSPNFNKVKSAGFIGSPASIASIASILLSITLLILNN